MSNPPNPLAKFRTYSYHHVMAVCDSTKTALDLSVSPTFSDVFTSRNSVDRLKVLETGAGNGGENGTSGKYIILIDGFADARFVIQEVKWATVLAPDPESGSPTTVETDGEMTILEPQGVRFMNELSKASTSLGSDPTGLIFVLKTFFIGHTDTGETEVITNIRPLFFILIDIQAEFSETGAQYKVAFVGMCNGAAKLPYVNEIASQIDIGNTGSDGKVVATLGQVFEDLLPSMVWQLYEREFSEVQKLYQKLNISGSAQSSYRPVRYKFVLDDYYKTYTFGTNTKLTKHTDINDPILSFSENTTFESIIEGIMLSSAEVAKDADNPTVKTLFKITSAIESTPDEYIVVFYVNKYEQRTPTIDQKINDSISGDKPFEPPVGTSIEFDYVFTGKNIDIKQFDIKMEMGLAFFQLISTTSNLPNQSDTQTQKDQSKGKGPGGADNTKANAEASTSARTKTPLFLGGQNRNALIRNSKNAASTMNFKSMLSRWAAIENIQVKMVIAGNPQLLDEMSVGPADLVARKTEEPKEGQTINPSWMTIPTFVRINIMMPTDNQDEDYAEKFWFDGYYQMLFINNIFDGGLFTQELELFSIPYGDLTDALSDDSQAGSSSSSSRAKEAGTSAAAIGSSPQDIRAAAAKFIAEVEGIPASGKAYWDPSNQREKVAVGYGHQITATELAQGYIETSAGQIIVKGNRGIDTTFTGLQATKLLEKDIPKYESRAINSLENAEGKAYQGQWDKLAPNQKVALISYTYNKGNIDGLINNGIGRDIKAGDTPGAANIIRTGATTAGGQTVQGLVVRREKEARLFESTPIPASQADASTSSQVASVPPPQDSGASAPGMTGAESLRRVT